MLWGLILAMPICGVSGVLAQWLGAQHYHRVAAFEHTSADRHSHFGLLRHHHSHADRSVVAIGVDSAVPLLESVPAAASLMPLVALTAPPMLLLHIGLRHVRPQALVLLPQGRDTEPLDRPPDARPAHTPST